MIIELGRLTADVELKTASIEGKGNIPVVNNRIAIQGRKNQTSFIDITIWDRLAEFVAEHFEKGDELYIEGYIRNKDYKVGGKTVQVPYILVDSVRFTHGKKKENTSQG